MKKNHFLSLTLATSALVLLTACGEKQTTTASDGRYQGKADSKPWEASGKDKAAWESQLKNRAQNQNEYSRTE